MPFIWMKPKIPDAFKQKIANRFREMHIREIEQRARLLFNLQYDKDHAIRRIQERIAWEFELSSIPDFYYEVPEIVERVYKHEQRGKNW